MLTSKQIKYIREELATAKNPLFFFDDDQDGVCSFILLYKMHQEGNGCIVNSVPKLDLRFFKKVEEHHPDKIFILDIPEVDQEFIDRAKKPTIWIDHHPPQEIQNLKYFNPRITQPHIYIPTTRLAYQINNSPENLWIATIGCLGDYHLPDFIKEVKQKYPDLIKQTTNIEKLIYQEPISKLIRIFAFLLKGKTSEVKKCIKILIRTKSPYEILNQETPAGKYLYKRFEKIEQEYLPLIEKAQKQAKESTEPLLLFNYTENSISFTSELSEELLYFNPDKLVLITRKKNGKMKCSLRSKNYPVSKLLEKSLIGIEGYGGGHELACGAVIDEEDWQQFLKNLKKELKNV